MWFLKSCEDANALLFLQRLWSHWKLISPICAPVVHFLLCQVVNISINVSNRNMCVLGAYIGYVCFRCIYRDVGSNFQFVFSRVLKTLLSPLCGSLQNCNWVVIFNVVFESWELVIGNWYLDPIYGPEWVFRMQIGGVHFLRLTFHLSLSSSYISSFTTGGLLLTAKTSKLIKTLNLLSLAADDAILSEILSWYFGLLSFQKY